MSGKLLKEIHKARPFDSPRQEAFLNVIRTADHLMRRFEELLKPHNISATQYNVLRILRGAGPEGLACQECANRMITREPDTTRLFDRLESRHWVRRTRSTQDRRVVKISITEQGLALLSTLDQPMADLQKQLSHLGDAKLRTLIDLLEEARTPQS